MGKLFIIQLIQLASTFCWFPQEVDAPKIVKVANFKANANWDETKIFDGIWTAELLIYDELPKIPPIIFDEKDEKLKRYFAQFEKEMRAIDKSPEMLTLKCLARSNGNLAIGLMGFDEFIEAFYFESLVVRLINTPTSRIALIKPKPDDTFWFFKYEIREGCIYLFEPSFKAIKENIAFEKKVKRIEEFSDDLEIFILVESEFQRVIDCETNLFSNDPFAKLTPIKKTLQND